MSAYLSLMVSRRLALFCAVVLSGAALFMASLSANANASSKIGSSTMDCIAHQNFTAPQLHSDNTVDFCQQFEGKVILAVNTASHCGFTPQFEALELLHQKYKDQGLAVVGFPSDDFNQESADAKDIAEVCYINYGVSFPMLSASSVKGDSANSFFKWLIEESGHQPKWNFNKYLVNRDGSKVVHYSSSENPEGGALEDAVVELLGNR